jgi:hypothetical protein
MRTPVVRASRDELPGESAVKFLIRQQFHLVPSRPRVRGWRFVVKTT